VFLGSKQGLEAIELVRGEVGHLKGTSFQVAPDTDLKDVVKELSNDGIKAELRSGISPGVQQAVRFLAPNGTPIDVYAEYSFAKDDRIPSIFNILKLGHVAYRVLDVQQIVKFYCEVLGFRVSDWRGDFFVFLRCNTDHHTLNFIIDDKPQLHHIAFEVIDWSEIHKAVDYLAHNNVHLVWGPGRHVIGHNVATYHRNSDLVRVEIFCEMDQMKDEALGYFDPRPWHQEFPLRPKMHGPETLRNYWGFGSERVIQGYQTNEIPKYGEIRG
jgi:catechol 2,3-dioxygenase-like lactoylglutathione lyase family enzyme